MKKREMFNAEIQLQCVATMKQLQIDIFRDEGGMQIL
jgi:hypothetical protein